MANFLQQRKERNMCGYVPPRSKVDEVLREQMKRNCLESRFWEIYRSRASELSPERRAAAAALDAHYGSMTQEAIAEYHKASKAPELRLSDLMHREMGIAVSPTTLRLFIKAHWSKITKLAHEIHED